MSMSWRDYLEPEPEEQPPLTPELSSPVTFGVIGGEIIASENQHTLTRLTIEQRWAIGHWLNTIREHEPEHREIVRLQCDSDPLAREWYLLKAERMPTENRRTCLQCRRWRGGACTSQATDRARTNAPQELGTCTDYCPCSGDPDTRKGSARWPEQLNREAYDN